MLHPDYCLPLSIMLQPPGIIAHMATSILKKYGTQKCVVKPLMHMTAKPYLALLPLYLRVSEHGRTCRTAYMLSEENWRHSVLHCTGDRSTTSAGSSGHSAAATMSNPAPEVVAVSAAAMLSWVLLDVLSEACSRTALSTTDATLSCTPFALNKQKG